MASRYRQQVLYLIPLLVVTGSWLAVSGLSWSAFPGVIGSAALVGAFLLVWHCGLPVPALGLVSLERVPQIATLLIFGPPVAAVLNAIASLVFPFTNLAYSQGSYRVAGLRGVHNACMSALMALAGGAVYAKLGGRYPLVDAGTADVVPLVGLALSGHAVNLAMMAVFYWLDGRDVRRIITPLYAWSDLLFVPGGVLVAVVHASAPPAATALLVGVLALFALSFTAIAKLQDRAEAQLTMHSRMHDVGRALSGARHVDELAERILDQCRTLFRFESFRLVLVDPQRGELDVRLHDDRGERHPRMRLPLEAGLFGHVVRSGECVLVDDWATAPQRLAGFAGPAYVAGSSLIVPLVAGDRVIGLVDVDHRDRGVFTEADLNLMQRLAERVDAAVADARAFEELDEYRRGLEHAVAERTEQLARADREKQRLLDELRDQSRLLERQSREDPLTGLANRRELDRRLDEELARVARLGGPLALALLDVDHFKSINDEHGHAVGDVVLREIAQLMRAQCRAIDVIARYGGEEFALLLPSSDAVAALALCDRIRAAVAGHHWHGAPASIRVSISVGVAVWATGTSGAALLERADTCLYEAKRAGRNRVVA